MALECGQESPVQVSSLGIISVVDFQRKEHDGFLAPRQAIEPMASSSMELAAHIVPLLATRGALSTFAISGTRHSQQQDTVVGTNRAIGGRNLEAYSA
jgi:hypothetical protein